MQHVVLVVTREFLADNCISVESIGAAIHKELGVRVRWEFFNHNSDVRFSADRDELSKRFWGIRSAVPTISVPAHNVRNMCDRVSFALSMPLEVSHYAAGVSEAGEKLRDACVTRGSRKLLLI